MTCAGATINSLAIGTPVVVTGDNSSAVLDPVFNTSVVWEAFSTVECADVTIGYCGTTPSFAGSLNTLAVGCPLANIVFNSSANILPDACGDGNFTILFPDLPAGTYYFPVLQGTGSTGPYIITFTATACSSTPPANAVCEGAIELPSAAECTPVQGTVAFATAAGNTGLGCENGDVADGVWYSFVAQGASYDLTVAPSAQFNAHVEVFSGPCDALTSIGCSVGDNFGLATVVQLTGLTIGDTYHVRVNDWYSGSPVTTSFFICLELVTTVQCDADAGSITTSPSVCLVGGQATITATPGGNAVVPEGFLTLYFLSVGAEPVIVQGSLTPSFIVSTPGNYAVHTLVYNSSTLDLNGLVFGQTTAASIDEVLLQGGGDICASFDLTGAPVTVEECPPCSANAGTLQPNLSTFCFANGTATINATHGGNIVVPQGFETVYLLTTGPDLIIQQGAFTPAFVVTAVGEYTLHTVVYDPTTLDLTTVVFGVTSGVAVNEQLIQGGGAVCAALDVEGATVSVEVCTGIAEQRTTTWSIWPNPNTGCFQLVDAHMEGPAVVQVFGPDGRSVHEQRLVSAPGVPQTLELPVGMAKGLYTVRLLGPNGTQAARMVLD